MTPERQHLRHLKLLAGACALSGLALGIGTSATYAAFSDTETAATQTITAASCFDRETDQTGKAFGSSCAGPDEGKADPKSDPKSGPKTASSTESTTSPSTTQPVESAPADSPTATTQP